MNLYKDIPINATKRIQRFFKHKVIQKNTNNI